MGLLISRPFARLLQLDADNGGAAPAAAHGPWMVDRPLADRGGDNDLRHVDAGGANNRHTEPPLRQSDDVRGLGAAWRVSISRRRRMDRNRRSIVRPVGSARCRKALTGLE